MLKKTITYKDFDDNEVVEEHFFHLSKADVIEMNFSKKGGFGAWFEAMTASDDQDQIFQEIKKLVTKSYGVKSPDGKRFIRNQEVREAFLETEAFSELLTALCTDEDASAAFINGVFPAGLEEDLAKIAAKQNKVVPVDPRLLEDTQPLDPVDVPFQKARMAVDPAQNRVLTQIEVQAMDADELKHLLAQGATIAPQI